MKDFHDPLQDLFDSYQPALTDDALFMARLEGGLRVADTMRQLRRSQARSQWRILLVTFLTGLLCGLGATWFVLPALEWTHTVQFSLMGVLVSFSPVLAPTLTSLLCALLATAAGLAALRHTHSRQLRRALRAALG